LSLWIEKSGKPIRSFFNTSGMIYRALKLKDELPQMDPKAQIELLATDGMLVKRPIFVTQDKVFVGYREGDYDTILT
jgi:arsenate reductase